MRPAPSAFEASDDPLAASGSSGSSAGPLAPSGTPPDFDGRFDRVYLPLLLTANRLLLRRFADVRERFGGDFERLLLLGALVNGNVGDWLAQMPGSLQWLRTDGLPDPASYRSRARPVTTSELAEATGIARETVRRKMRRLHADHLVERLPDGRWLWRIEAAEPGRSLCRDALRQLLVTADQLRATLDTVGTPPPR